MNAELAYAQRELAYVQQDLKHRRQTLSAVRWLRFVVPAISGLITVALVLTDASSQNVFSSGVIAIASAVLLGTYYLVERDMYATIGQYEAGCQRWVSDLVKLDELVDQHGTD